MLLKVLNDFDIKIYLICIYDNTVSNKEVNKIIKNRGNIWDIQKSIEAEEKWALKERARKKNKKK